MKKKTIFATVCAIIAAICFSAAAFMDEKANVSPAIIGVIVGITGVVVHAQAGRRRFSDN